MAVASYILFAPPLIGLASQGDFERELNVFGLSFPGDIPAHDRNWNYFIREWQLDPAQATSSYARSSHMLFVRAALLAASVRGTSGRFDIRYLGSVQVVMLGLLAYWAARLVNSWALPRRILLYLLGLGIATDIGYLAYFQSFYFESATWLWAIALALAGVALVRRPGWWELAAYGAAASLFVSAKRHNALLALFLAGFLLLFAIREWRRRPWWTVAATASIAVIGCCALYVYVTMPYRIRRQNAYQFVTMTLLPQSPDVPADLRALGLGPRVGEAIGNHAFADDSPFDDPRAVPPSFGRVRVLSFLVQHPLRLLGVLGSQAPQALRNQLDYLGNFERGSGRPAQTQWQKFNWWDRLRGTLACALILIAFAVVHLALLCFGSFRMLTRPSSSAYAGMTLQGLFGAMAVAAYVMAVLGDGNEVQKHLFLPNALIDICLMGALASLTAPRSGTQYRSPGTEPEPSPAPRPVR